MNCIQLLKSKGFSEEEILASSLVNKNEDGKFIDRFREQINVSYTRCTEEELLLLVVEF